MSSAVCQHCGCSEIDKDPARGDAVCTGCGSVLEDQIIISEVQFQENSLGGSNVIGQYVSAEGGKSHSMGSSFHHGFGKESREITLLNGKRKIQSLGNQLRLNQHCIDTAYNFFKMAVGRRLTRGRKTTHVIAACLYLVCRTEGTPHMLLDFSDVLQINVYILGRTYLHMAKELCINVPCIDPCLMIPRFSSKLEFGDKVHEVEMTAMRLVSRMKRDWMHVGRRPSGLCGAALLVAARIHDFSRSQKDIIKVVKIGEATIRKRLTEFEKTASSQLTIDEFNNIDLEQEADPPSFTESKQKAKLAQLEDPKLPAEMAALQEEIEKALEATPKKGRWASYNKEPVTDDLDITGNSELDVITDSTAKFIEKEVISEVLKDSGVQLELEISDTPDRSQTSSPDVFIPGTLQKDYEENNLKLRQLMPPPWQTTPLGPGPTAASLGLKESIEECMNIGEKTVEEDEDGELDLEGINDEELDAFILNEDEVKRKTVLWTRINADYILEQKEKEEKEAKLQEENAQKPPKKKRAKRQNKSQASTAGEAIEKMIHEKKISSKINYDVLKDLNKGKDNQGTTMPVEAAILPPSVEPPPTTKNNTVSKKRLADTDEQEPPKKKVAESEDVLVETGPVQYQEDEDIDEEDDEDEEDQHMSAAQLLGHGRVEGYEEFQDGYDEDID